MIFTQAIQRNAQLHPHSVATTFLGREKTWLELQTRIAKFASALHNLGIQPGQRVAILSLNSDRYLEYFYAAAWAGVIMVPLNVRWSLKENEYALNDAGAVGLLVDDTFLELGLSLEKVCPEIQHCIHIGENDTPQSILDYEALIRNSEEIPAFASKEEDLLGIFYTGGTTGFPKGVMLSHKNIWTSSMTFMTDLQAYSRESPVMLIAGPMFHMAAGALTWSSVIAGMKLSIVPMFTVDGVLKCIQEDKVTDTLLVPTMINMLLNDKALDSADISSLKSIIYGASPMPEGTLIEAMEKMPTVGFIQAYGQTELAPLCSVLHSMYHVLEGENSGKIRSAGRPSYCVRINIKNEQGDILPAHEVGEICVQGPNMMMGYWNKPEQTAETIVDGWLHTGDAGYLDDDGFIFLVDRVKDMIISGGENIFSAEVESAISKHPEVSEVAVVGIPSEEWGEAVHAIIRRKPDATCSEKEIIAFCREYIAGYKVPRSIEFREEPFPITGAGKIQKNTLRDTYWKGRTRNIN